MLSKPNHSFRTSRREFLSASGAAAIAASFGAGHLPAQGQLAKSYTRLKLRDNRDRDSYGNEEQARRNLDDYVKAITAMLLLPPKDPRNWYRNAIVHLLDCPHGNWWFLPWHRGYLYWFEQTCRELTGASSFALPYWDWTDDLKKTGNQYLSIPEAFVSPYTVLNPSNVAFLHSFCEFKDAYTQQVDKIYKELSEHQRKGLMERKLDYDNNPMTPSVDLSTPENFWKCAETYLFPSTRARQTNFDGVVLNAIGPYRIMDALDSRMFAGVHPDDFGSGKTQNHYLDTTQGVLEQFPHNKIHNGTGGFMGDMFSPVDPLFFMHHANIDRLWDVWTRKQQAQNLPPLPVEQELAMWQKEPFPFFVNEKGKPVPDAKAGDYTTTTIAQFNYTYEPGTGEQVVTDVAPLRLAEKKVFRANLTEKLLSSQKPLIVTFNKIPTDFTHPKAGAATPRLYAHIEIKLPSNNRGVRYHVFVNPPQGVRSVDFGDPSYAGTLSFFGSHSHGLGHGEMAQPASSFNIPLTAAVAGVRAAGRLKKGELQIQVVPDTQGVTLELEPFQSSLEAISIEVF